MKVVVVHEADPSLLTLSPELFEHEVSFLFLKVSVWSVLSFKGLVASV